MQLTLNVTLSQNNIYGVDIERGAVDMARLRFWLSLIVDEKSPEALLTLISKIMGIPFWRQYKVLTFQR